jgi:soluble lytic murein transglycosylase
MRVTRSSIRALGTTGAPLLAKWTAGALAVLMAVSPLAAEAMGDVPATPETTASHAKKTGKAGLAKSSKSKSGQAESTSAASTHSAGSLHSTGTGHSRPGRKGRPRASRAARAARTARIHKAFVASTELRPMAQQLATLRTPAAYEGVTKYARAHTGEAASAAYLALGHAYMVDRNFAEGAENLRQAKKAGEELADYADYLTADADHQLGNEAAAEALLHGFIERYPDSIFDVQVPELEAAVLLAQNNAAAAERALDSAPDSAARTPYQLALGQVDLALGKTQEAEQVFKKLLLGHPLTSEAATARAKLTAMGAESSLTIPELRSLGDAYYNAGPLLRCGGAVSRAGAEGGAGCDHPQRLCRGRGGLRTEAEAADAGRSAEAWPTRRRERGAAALPA